jgi:hypothetical protein
MFDEKKMTLTGAELDTLYCLFRNGATWDGNIPSKCGRDSLIDRGFAYRDDGWTVMTIGGFHAAIAAGMDKKKGTR